MAFFKPDKLTQVEGPGTDFVIVLHSGRNRIIRRFFEHAGAAVERLDRVSYSGISKKDLARGAWRELTEDEIALVKKLREPSVAPEKQERRRRARPQREFLEGEAPKRAYGKREQPTSEFYKRDREHEKRDGHSQRGSAKGPYKKRTSRPSKYSNQGSRSSSAAYRR